MVYDHRSEINLSSKCRKTRRVQRVENRIFILREHAPRHHLWQLALWCLSSNPGNFNHLLALSLLSGNYVYIETSSPRRPGEKAYLFSPQVSGVQCVKFSYHMNGLHIGSLKVYQNTGSLKEFFTKSGRQGNKWKKAEVQVNGNSYSVSICNFVGRQIHVES